MQFNPNMRSDRRTFLALTLEDRSDGEEPIEPKVVGVHTTDNQDARELCTLDLLYIMAF